MQQTPDDILRFWFVEHGRSDWFRSRRELDLKIERQFSLLHRKALDGALSDWRVSLHGCLAEILVLDQFSRHLYRKRANAFAGDPLALERAQAVVSRGEDVTLTIDERHFLYMPFMHSESLAIQDDSVRLFGLLGDGKRRQAERHRDIIRRFGRYPHRNAALNRKNTMEEEAYLRKNSRFGQ
ncbi:MAG: DUF924 family protein [Myxococcota bacterium]|nr:DUF924 family protein [Myxococcota bacterium]